jgi:TRAP-type mannitol/chloroaromatic compound transport system permease small subunit
MLFKKIYHFFDRLEDKVRGKLSHLPISYALLGGIGVVLFWRGVWHTVDYIMGNYFALSIATGSSIDVGGLPWWDGPLSFAIGSVLLLMTGIFVSSFIGNEVIISGLKGEKRIAEKTEGEVREEKSELNIILKKIDSILEVHESKK